MKKKKLINGINRKQNNQNRTERALRHWKISRVENDRQYKNKKQNKKKAISLLSPTQMNN